MVSLIITARLLATTMAQDQESWGSILPNGVANAERVLDPAPGVCATEVSEKVGAQPGTPEPFATDGGMA